jgi:hypothetical protein
MQIVETAMESFIRERDVRKMEEQDPFWYRNARWVVDHPYSSPIRMTPRLGQIIDAQDLIVGQTYTRIFITPEGREESLPPFKVLSEPFELTPGELRVKTKAIDPSVPFENNRIKTPSLADLGIQPDKYGYWDARHYTLAGRVSLPLLKTA